MVLPLELDAISEFAPAFKHKNWNAAHPRVSRNLASGRNNIVKSGKLKGYSIEQCISGDLKRLIVGPTHIGNKNSSMWPVRFYFFAEISNAVSFVIMFAE